MTLLLHLALETAGFAAFALVVAFTGAGFGGWRLGPPNEEQAMVRMNLSDAVKLPIFRQHLRLWWLLFTVPCALMSYGIWSHGRIEQYTATADPIQFWSSIAYWGVLGIVSLLVYVLRERASFRFAIRRQPGNIERRPNGARRM
jgi:hypothetical protein